MKALRKLMFVASVALMSVGTAVAQNAAFTEQQMGAGLAAYQGNCASCHQNDLTGSGAAVPLRGQQFLSTWNPRTAGDLVRSIQATMPPDDPGGLPDDTYVSIAAFILSANGAEAGEVPLIASSRHTHQFYRHRSGWTRRRTGGTRRRTGRRPAEPGPGRRDSSGRSPQLRAGDCPDAPQSGSKGLAHDPR